MVTLQGMISKSVNNANVQFESLGYIMSNVANYNTIGYKSIRFENYLKVNGRLDGTARSDFQNGVYFDTNKPFDIAIEGHGFIPVTKRDGSVSYTRDGSLMVNSQGYLVTNDGFIVGDGIKVPHNYHKFRVSKEGIVSVIPRRDEEEQVIGKIPLVSFQNPEGLELTDGNKYITSKDSGEPTLIKNHDFIRQGVLERSNVNLYTSVNEVLKLNASLIASTRILKVVDEFYRQSINLRQ